mmetsp:Transcript_72140/g.163760  ORF Transcript_72140/g.163760 Transcript_72140/m.163760 type:complete len:217 (-) Transcript_72140:542-1192(-)
MRGRLWNFFTVLSSSSWRRLRPERLSRSSSSYSGSSSESSPSSSSTSCSHRWQGHPDIVCVDRAQAEPMECVQANTSTLPLRFALGMCLSRALSSMMPLALQYGRREDGMLETQGQPQTPPTESQYLPRSSLVKTSSFWIAADDDILQVTQPRMYVPLVVKFSCSAEAMLMQLSVVWTYAAPVTSVRLLKKGSGEACRLSPTSCHSLKSTEEKRTG